MFAARIVGENGRVILTGPDVLDYPPNHFLRWNAVELKNFLSAQGFEVLSVREQRAGIAHTAQMINMAMRTGMTNPRQSAIRMLGRMKHAACFPLALAALPYIRMRRYKGTCLYCLARLRD